MKITFANRLSPQTIEPTTLRAALTSLDRWNSYFKIERDDNDSIEVEWTASGYRITYQEGELKARYRSKSTISENMAYSILNLYLSGKEKWKALSAWGPVSIDLNPIRKLFDTKAIGSSLLVILGTILLAMNPPFLSEFLAAVDLNPGMILMLIIVVPFGIGVVKSLGKDLSAVLNDQLSMKDRLKAAASITFLIAWLSLIGYSIVQYLGHT